MAIVKILCGIDKMENIMLHFSSQNGVKHVIVIRPMVSTGDNSPPLKIGRPLYALPSLIWWL